MNPIYPVYIVSKGRWESRLTSKTLEYLKVPYHIIIEKQEYDQYASVIDPKKILILDPKYQAEYNTCDNLGETKSKGPGAARNFAWDHAIKSKAAWHWVMDDNIRSFIRLNNNRKTYVGDGTIFRVAEDFVGRYTNIAISGFQYETFTPRRNKCAPIVFNTRIYSCLLIRNDIPYRWRGRYNEDTDLSLRALKDGWCTVEFQAFLAQKIKTQSMKGGNTEAFYAKEGTYYKSKMQIDLHPDCSKMVKKFGRIHHYVDYKRFANNKLIKKSSIKIPNSVNEYGMKKIKISSDDDYKISSS